MTQVLGYVASPLHVLSALAAIKSRYGSAPVRVTLVVNYPTAASDLLDDLYTIAATLTKGVPLVEACVAVSNEAIGVMAGRTDVAAAAAEFRKLIGPGEFSEIYYFHDVMGVFFAMLAQSYPRARLICFGDALGTVFERQYHLSKFKIDVPRSLTTADPTVRSSFWDRVRGMLGGGRGGQYADLSKHPFGMPAIMPHAARVILPVDESGAVLDRIPWSIVDKAVVLELLEELVSRCTAYSSYLDGLLDRSGSAQKYVMMTECAAEAQFLTFDRDIEMNCTTVRKYCPPGSTVFLKPHPAEKLPRYETMKGQLGGQYDLVQFADARFKRYPIEFAPRLVRECTLISASYPNLSLAYLYGANVIQPVDGAFIEKWYPENLWTYLRHAYSMLIEPKERLAGWDGRSVLWAGDGRKR